LFELIRKQCTKGSHILELAAGSGAMSLRLKDHVFEVDATDYVVENFKLGNVISFKQADLNGNFSNSYDVKFDGIMASEIIEHLENPRNFARQCFKLLKPGGKLILSTPNIDSGSSIASYIRTGMHEHFNDKNYRHDGHITPLMQWVIEKSFSEAGFSFVFRGSFGDGFARLQGSPRLILLAKLINLISNRSPDLLNQIFVAVVSKPKVF